jgi:hypothetical protein
MEVWILKRFVTAAVMAAMITSGASCGARAQQPASPGEAAAGSTGWIFNVAPYLWLPSVNATLNYTLPAALDGRLPTGVSAGPGDILSHLNFATMVAADAQYGRFSLLTDFIYLNVGAVNSHFRSIDFAGLPSLPIAGAAELRNSTSLNASIWTLAGGYTLLQGEWGNVDAIAGLRYFGGSTRTNYDLGITIAGPRGNGASFGGSGSISGSASFWNGIGGFRGRVRLGTSGLFIPCYFDIGAGDSALTWQIASGLGYQTGWAGVSLTYRYLSFDQRSSAVLKNVSMGGPIIMANFTF